MNQFQVHLLEEDEDVFHGLEDGRSNTDDLCGDFGNPKDSEETTSARDNSAKVSENLDKFD